MIASASIISPISNAIISGLMAMIWICIQACKGLTTIYSSRIAIVPKNEVSHLLSSRITRNEVSEGSWARVKNGKYKGDLAQVLCTQFDFVALWLHFLLIYICFFIVDCGCEWCTKKSNSEAYTKNWSTSNDCKICNSFFSTLVPIFIFSWQ